MTASDTGSITAAPSAGWKSWLRVEATRLTVWCSLSLVIVSVLSLFATDWWIADLCANLRMQWTIGLLITAIGLTFFRKWKLLVIALVCFGLHLSWLADGVSTGSDEVAAGHVLLTVTTANVYTGNRLHADIEAELTECDADIVAVLELNTPLKDHLAGSFSTVYPYSLKHPQDRGNFGIGLYSKHPFESPTLVNFNSDTIASTAATTTIQGQPVHILATHTLPPMGARGFAHRNKHLQMIASYVRERRSKQPNVPVVVMGDLNLTPWSPVFSTLLEDAKLTRAGTGYGWTPTWYRFRAFPFGLMLDHVLTTEDLACQTHRVGDETGSDHRFVTAALAIK